MRELVDFISHYEPSIRSKLVPATNDTIEDLSVFAGELPGVYLRFLRTMGESTGDFRVRDAAFGPEGIIATYAAFDWLRSDRYVLIAGDRSPAAKYYFLDKSRPHGHDDCLVVRMPLMRGFDPDDARLYHVGLEEFLYSCAFRQFRIAHFELRQTFGVQRFPVDKNSAVGSTTVVALAIDLGFSVVSPCTRSLLLERADAAILLYRHPAADVFSFELGCDDAAALTNLTAAFVSVGMEARVLL